MHMAQSERASVAILVHISSGTLLYDQCYLMYLNV